MCLNGNRTHGLLIVGSTNSTTVPIGGWMQSWMTVYHGGLRQLLKHKRRLLDANIQQSHSNSLWQWFSTTNLSGTSSGSTEVMGDPINWKGGEGNGQFW